MSLEINQIHQGDARILLRDIEDSNIACSFWSPPYHLGKRYEKYLSYQDWVSLLKTAIRLHFPIIKPGGFLVINIADILAFPDRTMPRIQAMNINKRKSLVTREQVIEAMKQYPDYNRYQLAKLLGCSEQTIDRRLNGNNIRGGKYAPQTRVHLVGGLIERAGRDAGFYLYDRRIWVKDPAWQNSKWHTLSYRAVDEFEYLYIFWKPGITTVDRNKLSREEWGRWGSRAVWNIPSVRANDDHEAKFPLELANRVIKLFSAEGDVILDCFIGSGTTAVAAIQNNRNFIGIELDKHYVQLARQKCDEAYLALQHQTIALPLDFN